MRIVLATLLASATVACTSAPEGIEHPYGEDLGTPENPVPQQAAKTGPYQVATTMQFTIEQLLPAQVEFVVATLREFEHDPANALLNVAEAKGVPAVGALRDALPGFIEDRLTGWINDEIMKVKIDGKPITEYAGDVARLAEFSLTEFEIESAMAIDGFDVTHTLSAIDLSPTGWTEARLPIGGLAADILTAHPTINVGQGGAITFGDQRFGLAYGEYAWQGIEMASTAVFGQGVRASIGKAVNCPKLAQIISEKCALGACVGHESELKSICEGGLDALVDFAHDRFAAMRLDAFQYAAGQATLVDDDADGVGDRIVGGVWEAKMNIGQGLRHAPATFVGER